LLVARLHIDEGHHEVVVDESKSIGAGGNFVAVGREREGNVGCDSFVVLCLRGQRERAADYQNCEERFDDD
jgi:hypothetical protein